MHQIREAEETGVPYIIYTTSFVSAILGPDTSSSNQSELGQIFFNENRHFINTGPWDFVFLLNVCRVEQSDWKDGQWMSLQEWNAGFECDAGCVSLGHGWLNLSQTYSIILPTKEQMLNQCL